MVAAIRDHLAERAAVAINARVIPALIGAALSLTTEALGDPSKYRDDPIPYCLSYISRQETCDRDSKDGPWACTPTFRDVVYHSCKKWDEASILKFCRGWTDNNSVFGEVPRRGLCMGGRCYTDPDLGPAFVCLNPK
jgi:hypothetical protein